MPEAIEQDEITITEAELAARAERLGVEYPQAAPEITVDRILQFINESNDQEELKRISRLSRKKLKDMGVIPRRKPEKKASIFDRFIARLATEAVPILLTLFITVPLAVWAVVNILESIGFFHAYECPPECDSTSLTALALTSGLAFLFVFLGYTGMRKFFLRSRK